jgi:uncharacterized membrane protein
VNQSWQSSLRRWNEAGLVDAPTAERIRKWEAEQSASTRSSRAALLAFTFGGLMLTAGVLLFVAANWARLSPGWRFALVLLMIAVFHAGGAFASRTSAALSATLHAAGTGALGAGIYLAGQIFHMAEHWPGALMLWTAGAAIGVWLLRQWPQVLWLALLAPAWFWGEWFASLPPGAGFLAVTPPALGVFLLACSYLIASAPDARQTWRRALAWIGAIGLIPAAYGLAWVGFGEPTPGTADEEAVLLWKGSSDEPWLIQLLVGWMLALALPLGLGWLLRRRDALWLGAALAWALLMVWVNPRSNAGELAQWALYALGSAGLALWGIRDRQRLAVNIGVLGFALAIFGFYFSTLFERFGRALGLIGAGAIVIFGGWLLERARRRLVGRISLDRT